MRPEFFGAFFYAPIQLLHDSPATTAHHENALTLVCHWLCQCLRPLLLWPPGETLAEPVAHFLSRSSPAILPLIRLAGIGRFAADLVRGNREPQAIRKTGEGFLTDAANAKQILCPAKRAVLFAILHNALRKRLTQAFQQ